MNDQQANDLADQHLLKAWVANRDRQAIGELIARHIDFVHSVALRRVGGDPHLADDVTQAVFILLLRKAHRIQSEAAMTSWLYSTTRYAAGNANRMIRRRKIHTERWEQLGVQKEPQTSPDEIAENADTQQLLHEAIDQLTKSDRLCVVMSFLQQKTHGQVAAALGISQDAAREANYAID